MEAVDMTSPIAGAPADAAPSDADAAPRPAVGAIRLSVVVPTYNERANVARMVTSLDRVLKDLPFEVIFVDDASPDGTAEAVRQLARADRRVRLIERHNRRGLSSAVVEGGLAAAAEVIAVMDGDMQHDEAVLPELYRRVASGETEIAAASRFLGDGVESGLGSEKRVRISNTGIALANRLFGLDLTDPLTGFFALRRDTLVRALPGLSALGFKILLDVITSARPRPSVSEVGFRFRAREAGESKLDRRVMYDFFLFFLEKWIGRYLHIPARFISFALINSVGILVHLAVLVPLVSLFSAPFGPAQVGATLVSMFFNFAVNNAVTYNDRTLRGARFWQGFVIFVAVCSVGVFANVGVASLIHDRYVDLDYVVPAVAGAMITVLWNFAATKTLVWRRGR